MAKRKRKRDDDDDAPSKKKSSALTIVLIAGAGLALVLCVCGGGSIGAYLALGKRGDSIPIAGPGNAKNPGKRKDMVVPNDRPEHRDIANDPKWLASPDLNKLLGGRWRNLGSGFDFRADGTMEKLGIFGAKGTYAVAGSETVDITSKPNANPTNAGPTMRTCVVLINDDELALLTRSRFGDAKPNEYTLEGPFYRMRDDGAGLGRTRFIDPLIEKAKAGNPVDKANAIGTLGLLGPDAWPAVPTLAGLIETRDAHAGAAFGALNKIGPKAKAAVLTLRKCLNDKQYASMAVSTLGEIGPDAKDAIPDLRRMLPNAAVEGALKRIDPKGKF